MNFQRRESDGIAKLGILQCKESQIPIPTILYPATQDIIPPSFAEGIIYPSDYHDKHDDRFGLCVPSSLFSNNPTPCLNESGLDPFLLYQKDVSLALHNQSMDLRVQNNHDLRLIPAHTALIDSIDTEGKTLMTIIGSSAQLFREQSHFVDFIIRLRDAVGLDHILYLPLLASPSTLALLCYLGIDVFDASTASLVAHRDVMLLPTGAQPLFEMKEIPCQCPVCSRFSDPKDMGASDLLNHNNYALFNELKLVRTAIRSSCLRSLVEQRVRIHPHLASILRNLDINHQSFLETVTPVVHTRTLTTTTLEGLNRSEVKRFQDRIITRYQKPPYSKILLLLPCSATKPYSFSPSHKKINQALSQISNQGMIHEIIITSPLGLVPRELELIYPASAYDIPVTGLWYLDELHMIQTNLQHYLNQGQYDHIIIHLPQPLADALQSIASNTICTNIEHHPTSHQALETLVHTIEDINPGKPKISMQDQKKQIISAIASYQFGPQLAQILLKDTTIKGKYPYLRIMDNSQQQLGMTTLERGYISLTIDGAKRIASQDHYWVEIASDFTLKGSVFTPGIIDADPAIRSGDEVIIRQENSLKAVGVATMHAREMIDARAGEAVKTRHIIS